ncbi:MAG: hypothetical protein IH994_04290 [Proteobacteria bacterium]|nr:hypothetical protein [Pseudomonadota bacterium]
MAAENLQQSFSAFREECIWLRCCYNTYAALYESDQEVLEALSSTANIFFGDLNKIFIEYIWLQACKITDPAKSSGRDNLTVKYMDEALLDSGHGVLDMGSGLVDMGSGHGVRSCIATFLKG